MYYFSNRFIVIIIIMNERQQWINHGIKENANYMIIACNGKSCDDYPVYCFSEEEVKNKLMTEFNFFNLDCKTHHGVIDLNKYKDKYKDKYKETQQIRPKHHKDSYGNDGKIRKYRHMQLRTLNK